MGVLAGEGSQLLTVVSFFSPKTKQNHMSYQQLTEGKRYQISVLRAEGYSPTQIAEKLQVHRSTIYRELKRNRSGCQYEPIQAHRQALVRRASAQKARVPSETIAYVEYGLSLQWSPEQISAVGARISRPVSHEWIYRYVATNRAQGGDLYQSLRQGHKRYRRGKHSKRSPILEAVSIDERPVIVDSRERLGDWEARSDENHAQSLWMRNTSSGSEFSLLFSGCW